MATRLKRIYDTSAHVWASLHVERHGVYSVERLHMLHKYQSSTSLVRAWMVVVLTPLSCLVVVTLTDAIPLQPPSLGLASSHLFWLRVYITHYVFILTIMVQLQYLAPRLAVTTTQLLWVSSLVSGIGTAITLALALVIGYPLPFFFVLTAPGMCAAFMLCIFVVWGQLIRSHADVRAKVLNFYTLLIKNTTIMYTYALFNAAFSHLVSFPSAQTAMTLFLPILKLAAKNWINVNVQHMGCFRIEMLVFNVEIFHALYVVFFMQSATSRSTVAVLILLDAVQAGATLRRIMRLAGFAQTSVRLINATRYWSRRIVPMSAADMKQQQQDPQLIQLALFILEIDPDILQESGVTAHSSPPEAHIAGSSGGQQGVSGGERQAAPTTASLSNLSVTPSPSPDKLLVHQQTSPKPQPRAMHGSMLLTDDEKRVVSALSTARRHEKVYNALQLLHRTELIVLVEYVKLMIPFVYCLYLLAMSHLPNRVYYTQLCHLTGDNVQLDQKMANILLYALLELLSFLVLSWLLNRALQISSVHQLAFVLESQWQMAQAKLVFWVMFTVQSSLQHFGTDYSFQFKWLHPSPSPT
ncbi:hypothetical protein Gpo141_00008630 [Globisporangium polare]